MAAVTTPIIPVVAPAANRPAAANGIRIFMAVLFPGRLPAAATGS
jgi:hypothetical protein